jgi:hypothetical protein
MLFQIIQNHVNIRERYQHQLITLPSNLPLQVLPKVFSPHKTYTQGEDDTKHVES